MNRIKDVMRVMESYAPLAYQESYDNAGLITGDENNVINGVLVCLDCTEEIVEEAISQNCNLIVAHHPIIFSGLKKINGKNYVERTIIKAIKNDIAIYASHTNLDSVHNGVNARICEKLGLTNTRILVPSENRLQKLVTFCPTEKVEEVRSALFAAGAGHIGNYDGCSFSSTGKGTFRAGENTSPYVGEKGVLHFENEERIETVFPSHLENSVVSALLEAHPYEEVAYDIFTLKNKHKMVGMGMIGELEQEMDGVEFLKQIKSSLKADGIRYTKVLNKKIKTVAVCGGSGSFLLKDAIRQKADMLVTADFKYHQFFDAEDKIVIADVGHYESEQFTKDLICEILTKNFSNFAVYLTKLSTNPINYL